MVICVDTSVAMKWVFTDEDDADKAIALLTQQAATNEALIAPPLLYSEATNVIRQRMRRLHLSPRWAMEALDAFQAIPITLLIPDELYHDALGLAAAYELTATYDAQYVALAQIASCELWTDYQWLARRLQPTLPFVRALSEFAS